MVCRLLKRRLRQVKDSTKYYFLWPFIRLFGRKTDIWLLSERGTDARDNGYRFYLYLKREHPEIKYKYVISKKSPDCDKIAAEDIVKYGSLKHFYYYIKAPMLISTHIQGYSPNFELFTQLDRLGLVHKSGKKIFLQHGITKENMGFDRKSAKVDLLVCGAKKEKDYLLSVSDYGDEIVRYTGFPRYDNLFNQANDCKQNDILLMPTWRMIYTNYSDDQFVQSDYYRAFQMLINDEEIDKFLETHGYRILFYPHIEMQRFLHLFGTDSKNILLLNADSADVQDLLIKSSLLITDYSSVYFDFAYLKKPILYYQFDSDKYDEIHGRAKGWFDYERDGFGPVVGDLESLKKNLLGMKKFEMPEMYEKRVDAVFPTRDNKNCERVFNEIIRLSKQEN